MKHKQLVIFDWDGTVMDSANKIISSMQMAAEAVGLPIPQPEAVKQIIGISLVPAIQILFNLPDTVSGVTEAQQVAGAYKRAYQCLDEQPCELFHGIEELLRLLSTRGTLLAVATGKARAGLDRVWQQTGTGPLFTASRCADEAKSKPDPDMLIQILEETGVPVTDAVMIGDTVHDMAMAEALGMSRIAVSYGVHSSEQLAQHTPTDIVHSGHALKACFD